MHKILPTHITALHTGEFSISKIMHTDKTKTAKKGTPVVLDSMWPAVLERGCPRETDGQRSG